MRISDWSSDVYSSDLRAACGHDDGQGHGRTVRPGRRQGDRDQRQGGGDCCDRLRAGGVRNGRRSGGDRSRRRSESAPSNRAGKGAARRDTGSAERRVGEEGVGPGGTRGSPTVKKNKPHRSNKKKKK